MTVRVDQLTQDVFAVPSEGGQHAGEPPATSASAERTKAMLRQLERDARRTRSEGYDD